MSGGIKLDNGKPRMTLIPIEFLTGLGKALTFGASKYDDHNFRKGFKYTRLLDAAERHLKLENAGIESDRDSGLPHWAHAAASLAMYAFCKKWFPDLDDRWVYTEDQKRQIEEDLYGISKGPMP
jgi:hypothetical protein